MIFLHFLLTLAFCQMQVEGNGVQDLIHEEQQKEMQRYRMKPKPDIESIIPNVKDFVLWMYGVCFTICFSMYNWERIKSFFGKSTDLYYLMGVAMARIENITQKRYGNQKFEFGVGRDPRVIQRWIHDTWTLHDVDGNMVLDIFEVTGFIDAVLKNAGFY